jgi:hypothetical protein
MNLDNATYTLIKRLHAQQVPIVDIAEQAGLSYFQTYYVVNGKKKQPGSCRSDKGISRYDCMEDGLEEVKKFYFKQSKRKYGLADCISMAHRQLENSGRPINKETFKSAAYKRALDEGWETLWASRKQIREFQSALPKLHYNMWDLVGFNHLWCVDGRQSDMWVINPATGKMIKPRTFVIWELRTGMPLNVGMQLHDFNHTEVAMLMLQTVLKYGPPLLGILVDNGTEQIGGSNIDLFEAFWPPEIIDMYRSGAPIAGFTDIFEHARSPIVKSLAYIPTEFGKAVCERGFRIIKDCVESLVAGTAYQGGSRKELVHTTSKLSPTIDGTWMTSDEYFKLMTWAFTAPQEDIREGITPFLGIEHPIKFESFTAETGMRPTTGNAFQYCWQTYQQGHFPDSRLYDILYHCVPRFEHKRVVDIGRVSFKAKGVWYHFNCKSLGVEHHRKYVDVIIHPNDPTRAGIYYEGKYLDVARDVCRDMNDKKISVATAQKINGDFRKQKQQDVRLLTKGYDIAPNKKKLLEGLPEPGQVNVIDIQAVDQVYDHMQSIKQISPEADNGGTDLSEDMLDIVSRINQQL